MTFLISYCQRCKKNKIILSISFFFKIRTSPLADKKTHIIAKTKNKKFKFKLTILDIKIASLLHYSA